MLARLWSPRVFLEKVVRHRICLIWASRDAENRTNVQMELESALYGMIGGKQEVTRAAAPLDSRTPYGAPTPFAATTTTTVQLVSIAPSRNSEHPLQIHPPIETRFRHSHSLGCLLQSPSTLRQPPSLHAEFIASSNGHPWSYQRRQNIRQVSYFPYILHLLIQSISLSPLSSSSSPPSVTRSVHAIIHRPRALLNRPHRSFSSRTAIDDPHKIVKVIASDGKTGETREISYSNCKVIGNGSFGVVFQAKLVGKEQDDIAIKKVLQDKRFKVPFTLLIPHFLIS
jgi:hypothetical protein